MVILPVAAIALLAPPTTRRPANASANFDVVTLLLIFFFPCQPVSFGHASAIEVISIYVSIHALEKKEIDTIIHYSPHVHFATSSFNPLKHFLPTWKLKVSTNLLIKDETICKIICAIC
jgi:hypothetical protein